MTDQTIPADKVREIATAMRAAMRREDDDYRDAEFLDDMSGYIAELVALLPDPPLPTMVDMTDEERRECQWMQADVEGKSDRWLITDPLDEDGDVAAVSEEGEIAWFLPKRVTPRPDLPRFTWPGEKEADQ